MSRDRSRDICSVGDCHLAIERFLGAGVAISALKD